MFIVEPTLSDEEIGAVQQRLSEFAISRGAEVQKMAPWERRRLAYAIKGRRDGIYILAHLRCPTGAVREIEQQLAVTEAVLRHIVVRLDEE
jgi:small subunit ribosomal protein S6